MNTLTLKAVLALTLCSLFLHTFAQGVDPISGESYRSLTADGAWCWFSDPRAIYYEGEHQRTYATWVDSYGDIVVGYYDHQSGAIQSHVVHDGFEVDDHANPSILIDKHGYLMLFYARHAEEEGIRMSKSLGPEEIGAWEEARIVGKNGPEIHNRFGERYTYANVVYLAKEDRIYLFWRGPDGKPTFSYSEDGGAHFTPGQTFILPERLYKFRRPYVKVASNGQDKIGFTFTDGHPRRERTNSLYFMYLKGGFFYRADGSRIKALNQSPVIPQEADLVYQADTTLGKAWVWDVAFDQSENPVIAYVRFPDDSNHVYRYGRWDGEQWQSHDLVNAGAWFPQTPEGQVEREPNYSGGLSLDHEDPNTVYLSAKRDSVFEIEAWTTDDGGQSWSQRAITSGSSKDNVRPFAVRNAPKDNPLQLLWMSNSVYEHYTQYLTSIQTSLPFPRNGIDPLTPSGVTALCRQVADWQILNPPYDRGRQGRGENYRGHYIDWIHGAFYTGLWAFYEMTQETRYQEHIKNVGQHYGWRPYAGIFNADNHTFFQQAVELAKEEGNLDYIQDFRWVLDIHLARDPSAPENLYHNREDHPYHHEWWTWCDALYMSPPAFARMYDLTGEPQYLDYAIKYWQKTGDYLYSPENSLYYRDYNYFDQKSENGKSIFWGRGNGWVFAGLARFIPYIPEDHPERAYFVDQFKAMAAKLLAIQGSDGMWRASLLDPAYLDIGESSGTAFFTWGMAWGINVGLLDEAAYRPAVERAWQALCNNVNAEGRLGYVQQVAASPYPFYEHESQAYASGAFLGAGVEMVRLMESSASR